MLPALAQEFHSSLAEVAWVISLFAIAYGLMQIVYGPLADRIGKFRVVAFTTLMCSVGCLACALAPDLTWLVASRVLVAAFAAAIIPVTMAWVGDNTPYEIRQETLARVGLGTMLGLVSGQIIGGVFADNRRLALGLCLRGTALLIGWHQHVAQPLGLDQGTNRVLPSRRAPTLLSAFPGNKHFTCSANSVRAESWGRCCCKARASLEPLPWWPRTCTKVCTFP